MRAEWSTAQERCYQQYTEEHGWIFTNPQPTFNTIEKHDILMYIHPCIHLCLQLSSELTDRWTLAGCRLSVGCPPPLTWTTSMTIPQWPGTDVTGSPPFQCQHGVFIKCHPVIIIKWTKGFSRVLNLDFRSFDVKVTQLWQYRGLLIKCSIFLSPMDWIFVAVFSHVMTQSVNEKKRKCFVERLETNIGN